MKAIIITIICLSVAALFAAEINTSAFAPYINLKSAIWGQNNPDLDPILLKLYVNSNFGTTFTSGDLSTQVELGKNGNLRVLKAVMPVWVSKLTIGQAYTAGLDRCSAQSTDESFECDGPGKPGVMFMNREMQVALVNRDITVTILGPVKVEADESGEKTKGLPKVVVAYETKVGNINLAPVVGCSYYWNGDDSFNAGIIGLNFRTNSVQGQLFCAKNPTDFGLATILSSARQGNVNMAGGWVQLVQGNFTVGAGYSKNSKDIEAGSAFLNYKLVSNKYVTFIPEGGYFWGEGIVPDSTVYAGIKMVFAAK